MVSEASENIRFRSTFPTSEQKPFGNKGFLHLPEPLIVVVPAEIFRKILQKNLRIMGGGIFFTWEKNF